MESHKFNSLDERSQNESGSEEGPTVSLPLKTAYVAMKGVKVPLKMTRKKKRRRKTKPKTKWSINPKSGDKEWTPLPAKMTSTKILLIKNKPQSSSTELSSEDEGIQPKNQPEIWKQNNFNGFPSIPSTGQEQKLPHKKKPETMEDRQLQKLLGTDKQSQQMLLQFYKSNWERRKSLKEQEGKSVRIEFSRKECWG